jgi:hypothetical protein
MASKKRSPTFEIPDAVRQAGQSGWVYRTGDTGTRPKTTRPKAPLPPPPRKDRVTAVLPVQALAPPAAAPSTEQTSSLSPEPATETRPVAEVPAVEAAAATVTIAETAADEADRLAAELLAVTAPVDKIPVEAVAPPAEAPVVASASRSVAGWLFGVGVGLAVLAVVVPLYLLSGTCLAAARQG